MEETPIVETTVTMTIPELVLAISKKTDIAENDVENVVYGFIEYYLTKFKLK